MTDQEKQILYVFITVSGDGEHRYSVEIYQYGAARCFGRETLKELIAEIRRIYSSSEEIDTEYQDIPPEEMVRFYDPQQDVPLMGDMTTIPLPKEEQALFLAELYTESTK